MRLIPVINILDNSTGIDVRERLLHPELWEKYKDNQHIIVVYGELYGGNITKSKSYSTDKYDTVFRVFDIAIIPTSEIYGKCNQEEVSGLLEKKNYFVPVSKIDFRAYQAQCTVDLSAVLLGLQYTSLKEMSVHTRTCS
jgi:hypothetical protein